jgi:hypothetical protein
VQGEPGVQGPQGRPGIETIVEIAGSVTVPAHGVEGGVLTCPDGTSPITGGFSFDGIEGEVFESRRSGNGWQVVADNVDSSFAATLTIYAYCSPGVALAGSASGQSVDEIADHRRGLYRAGKFSP